MADDTEALKHEFFFRGFFKKRGFYSLDDLTPTGYLADPFFQTAAHSREWLNGSEDFAAGSDGHQILTERGKKQIDALAGSQGIGLLKNPIIIEGYSNDPAPVVQLLQAKERAVLVRRYLENRLRIEARDIGTMPLQATPPQSSGKTIFDGACIVLLRKA
ncbi:hypothetical protein ACPOL_2901 [Acidisarcina polymorpha]|uniref:Uncharacterized protein n=1 Tax=Acidisarcina polymorpha TaxID=2211140 RepID=A0A2Z5G0Q7_9BACT|nr:hypothetical protein [Acidisarcina polymorpha]AXC12205.1 hypothetical protein ACPOL_2901 [Acidisarcina polymorpha]